MAARTGERSGRDWTRREVALTVEAYLEMLRLELAGRAYRKAEHRRALGRRLDGRTSAAVERKHQNISAVLAEAHLPFISGYKPLGNYQALLADVVHAAIREGRFPAVRAPRAGASRSSTASEGALVIRMHLDADAAAMLRRPVVGSGGFQSLLRRIRECLNADDVLSLPSELVERIASYVDSYGLGGFQDRLGHVLVALRDLSATLRAFDRERHEEAR